jgi:hypothetical protein
MRAEKQTPKNATKFVTEVAIMADEAFLMVYATLPSRSSFSIGIYLAPYQVSLKRKVLSAPIPKTKRTTRMCKRLKNGIFRNIL